MDSAAKLPVLLDLAALPQGWPLFDSAASRAVERDAAAPVPAHTLMQRAGLGVARLALAIAPHARRIRVAAGPGNNGGDGFEAAMHLQRAGKQVQVNLVGDPGRQPRDASASRERAREAGVTIVEGDAACEADLVVDALLGLGAARAPQGALREAIAGVNRHCGPRLAVDLPSGLCADTGRRLGDVAVQASHTLCLLTLKPGLLTADGRDCCGELWLDPIGCAAQWAHQAARARLLGADDIAATRPLRAHASHKGRYGDLLVIGGAPGMAGAAWLAARAGLAAGAGRVFIAPLDPASAGFDTTAPELMLRPDLWRTQPQALEASTVVCGCGGAIVVRDALPTVLSRSARLVLDADALNAVAADAALQSLLRARAAHGRPTVLTPHPLEAARLAGHGDAAVVQADRLVAAELLAARYEAVVVLKGSGSVIAAPGRVSAINPTGNARLASAGTGDVLAGWLAGLWSASGAEAFDVACAAVWQHGAAAGRADQATPLRAGALIERLATTPG
jgi:hydroxyethylthiazole kinase-like uncharacterized protein yjeF